MTTPTPGSGPDPTARRIRIALAENGYRQAGLATGIGLSPQVLSARMRGQTPWMLTDVQKIARFLNVPVGQLVGDLDEDEQLLSVPDETGDDDTPDEVTGA